MTTEQTRTLTMLGKVEAFGLEHGDQFAPESTATARFARNKDFIAQMKGQATTQHGGTSGAHGATTLKSGNVAELIKQIKAVVDTGKTVFASDGDSPNADLEAQMRMPRHGKISALQTFARDLILKLDSHQAAFVAEEMPADFLTRLQSAIDAVGNAEADQDEDVLQHVGATTNLDVVARDAIKNVRSLDAPINNKFAGDAGILSEWDSASHIQVGLVGHHHAEPIPPV